MASRLIPRSLINGGRRTIKYLQSVYNNCRNFQTCPCPLSRRRRRGEVNEFGSSASYPRQAPVYLLPPQPPTVDKHCMVVDLDETLVHSTFEPIENPDYILTVEINGEPKPIYVLKRPYVDEFLQQIGQLYECVLFTASLAIYAEQLTNMLDQWNVFTSRLYRESCTVKEGCYIKDLSKLGRNLERVVILDNSPVSYLYHPENAVPVNSWFDDPSDRQLLCMLPFLERLAKTENVYNVLKNYNHSFNNVIGKRNLTKDFFNPVQ